MSALVTGLASIVTVDRAGWPRGPWDDEPDFVSFDTAAGYQAAICRVPEMGYLCGYVAVPKGNVFWERPIDELDALPDTLDVHGGITYAAGELPSTLGEPLWWIGFDAGHAHDARPGPPQLPQWGGKDWIYKTVDFMRAECERLAAQLRDRGASSEEIRAALSLPKNLWTNTVARLVGGPHARLATKGEKRATRYFTRLPPMRGGSS